MPQSMYYQGIQSQGIPSPEGVTQGMYPQGIYPQGMQSQQGAAYPPGAVPQGMPLPGLPSDVLQTQGIINQMLNQGNQVQGKPAPTTSQQPAAFQVPLYPGMPSPDVPVSPDYVIGPGDEIRVAVWGGVEGTWSTLVDRDGNINLPKLGLLGVTNLTFQQLKDMLRKEFSKYYTDFDMNISMGSLKTYKVYVVGNARMPGAYNISSLSTIINALLVSGGPSKAGSMRDIQVKRNGKLVANLDLYDFLIRGDRAKDERLMPEDVVFVPPIGPMVGVAGNVARPAIYELKGRTRLSEAIKMAGGVTASAYLQRVQVERVFQQKSKVFLDLDLQNIKGKDDILLQNGDIVKIFPITSLVSNKVTLQGNVRRPGEYEWKQGMRVSDILTSSEVLLPGTFMDYAIVERLVPPDLHQEYRTFSLDKLFSGSDLEADIALEPFDVVTVFNTKEMVQFRKVKVTGAVNKPGEFEYKENMKVSDLVKLAGGLTAFAFTPSAELTRIVPTDSGPKTEQLYVNLTDALNGDESQDFTLRENDYLLVRAVPEWQLYSKVFIYGEVKFPGEYAFKKGEKLSSLIERAGGYTTNAYLRGAMFNRVSAKYMQQNQINEMINRLERELFAMGNTDVASTLSSTEAKAIGYQTDQKRQLIEGLRRIEAKGRMVVILDEVNKMKGTPYDITLEENDTLFIPVNPLAVQVVGAVYSQSNFVYEPKKDYSFYIKRAGGFSKTADKGGVYILKVDGSAIRPSKGGLAWDADSHKWVSGYSDAVESGDTIVVPDKIVNLPWLPVVKDFTQILYQIAVGARVFFQ
ncbi:SLBB domain-containing protein [Desulforhabdus amnigena]|uniref:Sugar ABC transporter substrate-binding protein n=1 Tax=Desulforhabdus amnigena TaxID=40218 RepID=A0A9W6FRH1_9BACT|nr:SLBB domain-containing protein [Desulforhabdus amnigena]NLJ27707.1 polysaccharide biosynthesis protein [Deltaproteobacteria bacterium]GLI33003.1 sugar ABC transporter substrate-binding protein [Desulforhabdus amnigena]